MACFVPFTKIEEILPMLQDISIFGGLEGDDYYRVFRQLQVAVFEAGEVIFARGEVPDRLYILLSGKAHLLIGGDSCRLDLKVLGPGECFGEASLIGVRPHTATAVMEERGEVLSLSLKAILALEHEDLQLFAILMMNLARELARRLKLTDDILLHYAKGEAPGSGEGGRG